MAEQSTKALASKAFLVNHAEFEAFVTLRKDNFSQNMRKGQCGNLSSLFFSPCVYSIRAIKSGPHV